MAELKNVFLSFDSKEVLRDFSLKLPDSGVTYISGASGCGKTTMLRLLAGLEKPDSGTVTAPERIAFMFQEDRLLPQLDALENIEAVLPKQRLSEAPDFLDKVGLFSEKLSFPHELSGGMRRRVALARTLAYGAELLLLDEPYKGLDEALAEKLSGLIAEQKAPVVIVSHSAFEISLLPGALLRFDGPPLRQISLA